MSVRILSGDCRDRLAELPDRSVNCCITSPPYFGLRDYGVDGQIGLESAPAAFVSELVDVFREVRRVLADDGVLWLNLGDSYAGSGRGGHPGSKGTLDGTTIGQDMARRASEKHARAVSGGAIGRAWVPPPAGLKPKDLIGIPWMVAFALREDGWYLRQDVIWNKPQPMPESVTDRCTKAHEYVFMLSKRERYYFDAEAIAEPIAESSVARLMQNIDQQEGSFRAVGKKGPIRAKSGRHVPPRHAEYESSDQKGLDAARYRDSKRNKRSVWTVPTVSFDLELCKACDAIYRSIDYRRLRKEVDRDEGGTVIDRRVFCRCGRHDAWLSHFATYPPDLIEPCVLASCPVGGTVLDPFGGAGTTGLVADRAGRNAVLIELNRHYIALAQYRLESDGGMFSSVAAE